MSTPSRPFASPLPAPQVSFKDAVSTCLHKYVVFTGRARRSEYWFFWLFCFVVSVAARLIDGAIGNNSFVIGLVAALGLFLPQLAAAIRRLHDTDRSGWFFLLAFIPLVGGIILLVFLCQDSKGQNRFGDSPKYV